MANRLTWQDSWRVLVARGGEVPNDWPDHVREIDMPNPATLLRQPRLRQLRFDEADFENLTLPRTLIDGCRFHAVSFRNTDLCLAYLAAEFIDCDFAGCVLTCADLGRSTFFGCRFTDATLVAAELRGATLDHCDFAGADLTGARLDRALKAALALSDYQRRVMVDWRAPDDEGPDDPNQDE